MTAIAVPLPQFTEADPVAAGEGSLDPLGLASIADRLAESLLPGFRARMSRIRFVTISAIGALAIDDLFDRPASDGVSSASICFEWLVLEAFGRTRSTTSALSGPGVPGSQKVKLVIDGKRRLNANTYLRGPGVFGFTGVYLPLSRHLDYLDDERRPAGRVIELAEAWERDQGLVGYTDNVVGSAGGRLRSQIRAEVSRSLDRSECATEPGSRIWRTIAESFLPRGAGAAEKQVLTRRLTSSEDSIRSFIARVVSDSTDEPEPDLIEKLLAAGPAPHLQATLVAVRAYERLSWTLTAAFTQLRCVGTHNGTTPTKPSDLANDSCMKVASLELPSIMARALDALGSVDSALALQLSERLSRFAEAMTPGELGESLLAHHEAIQASKPPGKRPWFERVSNGWTVRSLYRTPGTIDPTEPNFVHPYRLLAVRSFMRDLAS